MFEPFGRKPRTTQEKIDAYTAKRDARRKPKAMSLPLADAVKKESKPKYLAPPGEVFQASKPKPKVTGLGKASSRRDKPVTTQEKIKQNEYKKMIERTEANRARAVKRKAAKKALSCGKRGEGKEEVDRGGKGERTEKGEGERGEGADGSKEKEKEKEKGKAKAKLDFPSTLALLSMTSTPSAIKFEDMKGKAKGTGVLCRPTARALDEKRQIANKQASAPPRPTIPAILSPSEKKKAQQVFRLMDLPKEVRGKIWKLAIVHHPFCVWPGQPRGREQPDLAMSGREVRDEVLPIYYGMNVFAIDITPLPKPEPEFKMAVEVKVADGKEGEEGQQADSRDGERCKVSEPKSQDEATCAVSSKLASSISKPESTQKPSKPAVTKSISDAIAEIKPWVKALESGGHLSQIQHCVFDCAPEIMKPPSRIAKIDTEKSLVVYLNIWRQPVDASEIVPETEISEVMTGSGIQWRAKVEIHHSACCVLPRHAQYQKCVVKPSPECLNGMVDCVLRAVEKRGGVTTDMIVGVADILRKRADELVAARCNVVG